jgi:DNA (cytosine-5)-methyltransferase 1
MDTANSADMTEWQAFLNGSRTRPQLSSSQIRIVDLFSSVGGLTLGVAKALIERGFAPKPVFAADVDADALSVYQANWPTAFTFNNSVRHLVDSKVLGSGEDSRFAYSPKIIDPQLSELVGSVDILLAGPPCQGHSSLNNYSRGNDPRNELYLLVPAVAVALGVRHVIIENVPGVTRERNNVVGTSANLLEKAGYKISSGVLNADKFGWPQTRKRFFMIASRDSEPINLETIEEKFGQPAQNIMWAIGELQDSPRDNLMNSEAELSPENQTRIKHLFQENLFNLPLHLRPKCHQQGTSYTASYGRMYPDAPAPTLTTGLFSPGRGRFVHPSQPRTLTPREAARIQGFPDWYQFDPNGKTTRTNLSKWIGDAVPSILGSIAVSALILNQET